ncbi:MAG: AMMECR1 domain-containing protein [Planctomycetia bacterium]|nr:AMMECR1 domain-containing protein [Planctomycetia bacterium]
MVVPQSSPLISLSGLPDLTREERWNLLLTVARRIQMAIRRQNSSFAELGGLRNWPLFGASVSLKRCDNSRLRCGMASGLQTGELWNHLNQAALLVATADPRFPKLRTDELSRLRLEIWLFAHPEPVYAMGDSLVDSIDVRRHGLIVHREGNTGLLFPGMVRDAGWDAREALTHVCTRARLPGNSWLERETQIEVFESTVIEGDMRKYLEDDEDEFPEVPAAFLSRRSSAEHVGK